MVGATKILLFLKSWGWAEPARAGPPRSERILGLFCGFGLKIPKSEQIGLGLGFNNFFWADTRPAPNIPAYLHILKLKKKKKKP
jgi:hypothetical protein